MAVEVAVVEEAAYLAVAEEEEAYLAVAEEELAVAAHLYQWKQAELNGRV